MNTYEGLLNLDEAAQLMGVSKISLRRWTRDGSLTCVRVGSRGDRRFRRVDVERYIANRLYGNHRIVEEAAALIQ